MLEHDQTSDYQDLNSNEDQNTKKQIQFSFPPIKTSDHLLVISEKKVGLTSLLFYIRRMIAMILNRLQIHGVRVSMQPEEEVFRLPCRNIANSYKGAQKKATPRLHKV